MKAACTESNANIWPNYHKVLAAKAECRPEGIVVEELCAFVPLQNLLDHTTKKILLSDLLLLDKIKELAAANDEQLNIKLYFKFGLDGCGSFNTFMQKAADGKVPDGSTLLTSQMVPICQMTIILFLFNRSFYLFQMLRLQSVGFHLSS